MFKDEKKIRYNAKDYTVTSFPISNANCFSFHKDIGFERNKGVPCHLILSQTHHFHIWMFEMLFTCVSRNKYGKDIFLSPPPNERISKSEMIGIIAHILSLQPIVEKKIYSYIMNNNILRNNGNEDQEITLDRLADEDLLNIDIAHYSLMVII